VRDMAEQKRQMEEQAAIMEEDRKQREARIGKT